MNEPVPVLPDDCKDDFTHHIQYNDKIGALLSTKGRVVRVWSRYSLPHSVASLDISAKVLFIIDDDQNGPSENEESQ